MGRHSPTHQKAGRQAALRGAEPTTAPGHSLANWRAQDLTPHTTVQALDPEKIFSNDMTDKRLMSNICKQLIKLYINKIGNPITKWAEDLNRHFSKGNIQIANRQMKRYSRC